MTKILVIEDDLATRENTLDTLELEGFEVVGAKNGQIGVKMAREHLPDLILCDIQMPLLDGYGVLLMLRSDPQTATIPFIFLTGMSDRSDLRQGMDLGADDYVTKPFNPRELVARVKAILRRTAKEPTTHDEKPRTIANLTIDPARHTVTVDGQTVDLRAKEFDLLLALVENEGIVLSREKLLDIVWGFDFYGETRTVDVHVAHVRAKLGEDCAAAIETVWGVGYKLVGV